MPLKLLYPSQMMKGCYVFVMCLLLVLTTREGYGQCGPYERVYATTEAHSAKFDILFGLVILSEVENSGKAVDISNADHLNTYSTLRTNVGLLGLGTSWQNLRFTDADLPIGDNSDVPVSVKLGTGSTVLNVLSGITVQATFNNNPVGTSYSGSSLLGLLGGIAQNVITFVPGAKYNGVSVTINPVVDIGTSVDLYYAYFTRPATIPIDCDQAVEVLYGATGSILGSLNSVDRPKEAIDNDLNTFAKINSTVSAFNETYITALYPSLSQSGDLVKITLQADNAGLLNASILSNNLHIRAYNANNLVTDVVGNSSFLDLQLLPNSGNKYTLTFPVDDEFDRITIAAGGGLVTLLSGLRVFEIERIVAKPTIEIDGAIIASKTICAGNSVELSLSAQSCTEYKWYTEASGGTSIHEGSTFTVTPNTTITYYVEASRQGCTSSTSERVPVTITVNPQPVLAPIDDQSICAGQSVDLTSLNPVDNSGTSGGTYAWSATPGGPALSSTTVIPSANTTYWVRYTKDNCSAEQSVNVIINPKPLIELETIEGVCQGISVGSLVFKNALGAPTTYSIVWSTASKNAGFNDKLGITFPINGPIILDIPVNISAPQNYDGTLIIHNQYCSEEYPISVPVYYKSPTPNINIQNVSQY